MLVYRICNHMASQKKHCLHRLVWGTKLKKRYACSSTCFSLEPIGDEQHGVSLDNSS
jgi:hypothetical protein